MKATKTHFTNYPCQTPVSYSMTSTTDIAKVTCTPCLVHLATHTRHEVRSVDETKENREWLHAGRYSLYPRERP